MSASERPAPEPSELPPNPSMGELVTEIDRARHDAAKTAAALADKFDVRARVSRRAHDQLDALRWDGRRVAADLRSLRDQVADVTPESVAKALHTALDYARRIPVPVRVAIAVVLIRMMWPRGKRK